jgi:exonuclease V gamma subunit
VAARVRLRALLTLATQARLQPLPLMPRAALAYVAAEDPAAGTRAAGRAWTGAHGEGHDAWVRVALRGAAPFAGDQGVDAHFAMLARELFEGLPGVPALLEDEDDAGDAAAAGGDDG